MSSIEFDHGAKNVMHISRSQVSRMALNQNEPKPLAGDLGQEDLPPNQYS